MKKFLFFLFLGGSLFLRAQTGNQVFNVRDFGAAGDKVQNDQAAIQKAIDACEKAGGGMVYLPAGKYLSGTLFMRNNVRLYIEAGATLYSIKLKEAFPKDALIFGENVEHITIEGRGVVDGQAGYEWRENNIEDDFIRPNQELMSALGKPLTRSFPRTDQFGKLVLLVHCRDVAIRGLSFIDSPSWTINPVNCERTVIDGLYIHSSLKDGVWADGIDPDGCRDMHISNCTVETGDDALVFYSMNWFGPALPCENITVTNCRLTSSSSAIKFCDGNMNAVRNVTIDNCVILNSNRGIAFMDFDGGLVSDITISNLVIDCTRRDWFWWGDGDPLHFNVKRRCEVHKSVKPENDEEPAGKIRRVLLTNIIARGTGSCFCNGHPDNWMEDITINNFKFYLSHDPSVPYDKSTDAISFRQVRNLKLKDVEVIREGTEFSNWQSALSLNEIDGLQIDNFKAASLAGSPAVPVVRMTDVKNAVVSNTVPGSAVNSFLEIRGEKSGNIFLLNNDFTGVKTPFTDLTGKKVVKASSAAGH
ncbi:MAG TPA: glycosyl hydrolase family 28-related protein [Bacteroidales bacterium]|nr:glycosyl hydrolase family 28-related protein [Bacteroidales bacterium]